MNNRKLTEQNGFSLLELMIVVAIIGLLTMVAVPSYQSYIVKTHRVDGHSLLTDIALRQQQYVLDNRTYATVTQLGLSTTGCGSNAASAEGFYCASIAPTATGYLLTAIPQGSQVNDTACVNLIFNEAGSKTSSTGATDCW